MDAYVYRVPHIHDSVLGNILEAYGHTPLVKLDKIAKAEGLECDLCKCEQERCVVLNRGEVLHVGWWLFGFVYIND